MADKFEKTMPDFWKGKPGIKAFEVTGAVTLTLFIALNSEIGGLRTQVSDLHRYGQQLVPLDQSQQRDQERAAEQRDLRKTVAQNLQDWRATTQHIEQGVEQLEDDADRSLQAIEKDIGDLRVRLAALETRPDAAPELAKKQPNATPKKGLP